MPVLAVYGFYHENAGMGDSLLGGNLCVSATRRAAETHDSQSLQSLYIALTF